MLNELLDSLKNLFEYITFSAGASAIFALLISFIFGPIIVRNLTRLQIGESIREHGPDSHHHKKGTPTMGGVLIIVATVIPTLIFADRSNLFIQIICVSMIWMGCVGFYDDYLKSIKKKAGGLAGRYKLIAQSILGIFISFMIINSGVYITDGVDDITYLTFVPFLKYVSIDLFNPLIYTLFIIFIFLC